MTEGRSDPLVAPAEAAATVGEAITLQRAAERLRQERETFDQHKDQDARWFRVRLAIGWMSVFIIPAVAVFCGFVIVSDRFAGDLRMAAAGTLFVDVAGLAAAIWRATAARGAPTRLAPTTDSSTPP